MVTKQEYNKAVGPHWTPEAQGAWDDLKNALLSDPCAQRFDHRKLLVLRTDFSSMGLVYVLLQSGNDNALVKAAQNYLDGKGFTFMTRNSKAILHPICFGAHHTCGNKIQVHSHLGEGFSGDYTINKCQSYVFGQRFVWVTDCYAIKFILSYKGGNPAILRLQMRLMCWDVNIVRCPNSELVDADYWSRLGVDMDFDPLFWEYLEFTCQLCQLNPAPIHLPMRPENMRTTVVHASNPQIPRVPTPTHCTFKASYRISLLPVAAVILISRTFHFALESSALRFTLLHHLVVSSTWNWFVTLNRRCNMIELYIPF